MTAATVSRRRALHHNINHNTRTSHPHQLPSAQKALPSHSPLLKQLQTPQKKQRSTKIAKMRFEVPDDDDSIMSDAGNDMDLEGDSFDASVERINAAQLQAETQAQQAFVAQQATIARNPRVAQVQHQAQAVRDPDFQHYPTAPRKYNLRSPTHRGQYTPLFDAYTSSQPTTSTPPSTGKRKRSESQPPARDAYITHSEPSTFEGLRRYGGMFITIISVAAVSMLAGIWNYLRGHKTQQQEEIFAVETDQTGRKRRAVPAGSGPNKQQIATAPAPTDAICAAEMLPAAAAGPGGLATASQPPSLGHEYDRAAESPVRGDDGQAGMLLAAEGTAGGLPAASPAAHLAPGDRRRTTRQLKAPCATEIAHESGPFIPSDLYESIDPTQEEMYARFPGKKGFSRDDYILLREEKKEMRIIRHAAELAVWEKEMNARTQPAQDQWLEEEEKACLGERREAAIAALKEKFGKDIDMRRLNMAELEHRLQHAQGTCEHNKCHYIFHEFDGLQAHEVAKVYAEEVARETEEFNKKTKAKSIRRSAFRRTSARSKFAMTAAADPPSGEAMQASVAATTKAKARASGATKDESSRPTTASSHKQASYKGGLEPSPPKNPPGAEEGMPWSWDRRVAPGKSLLKHTNKNTTEAKDAKIEALINRSKKAIVSSPPKDERMQNFMNSRRQARENTKALIQEHKEHTKASWEVKKVNEKEETEFLLERARRDWEEFRLEKAAEQKAKEEEAARQAAEELARQKAIEDERARQAAEEAARQQAEAEAAARKAAEDEQARQAVEADYARKQTLIRPLDPEWDDRVKEAMANPLPTAVLAQAHDGTQLSRHDFGSLLPQEGTSDDSSGWLNDEIVNAFFAAIVQRKAEQTNFQKGDIPAFEAYNSAWWNTYKQKGVNSIARWSRRKGIAGARLLDVEKMFLPINTGAHWQLLVISPRARTIEVLDSLNRKRGDLFKAAREWLAMELGAKYTASEWTEVGGGSSKQTNTDDCGVFTAMNGLAAAKGYPYSAVKASEMRLARRVMAAVLINGGLKGDWEL